MTISSLLLCLLLPIAVIDGTGYLTDKQILSVAKSHQIHDVYRLLNITYGWPVNMGAVGYWNPDTQKWSLALTKYLKLRQQKKTLLQLRHLIERLRAAGIKVT